MKRSIQDLRTLLERVEVLEGPDREVDALLWALANELEVFTKDNDPKTLFTRARVQPHEISILGKWRTATWFDCDGFHVPDIKKFTASIDAAVEFQEAVLPGYIRANGKDDEGSWSEVNNPVKPGVSWFFVTRPRDQEPLAILIATLRARIAELEARK